VSEVIAVFIVVVPLVWLGVMLMWMKKEGDRLLSEWEKHLYE
jgi:hypothetical protein